MNPDLERKFSASRIEPTNRMFDHPGTRTVNENGSSEDYLLGSQARPDPYSESQSQTELPVRRTVEAVIPNGYTSREDNSSPGFSSSSRTPSPSLLTSHVSHQDPDHDHDMSYHTAEPGTSGSDMHIEDPSEDDTGMNGNIPVNINDLFPKITPNPLSSKSQKHPLASGTEDADVRLDITIIDSEEEDISHDGITADDVSVVADICSDQEDVNNDGLSSIDDNVDDSQLDDDGTFIYVGSDDDDDINHHGIAADDNNIDEDQDDGDDATFKESGSDQKDMDNDKITADDDYVNDDQINGDDVTCVDLGRKNEDINHKGIASHGNNDDGNNSEDGEGDGDEGDDADQDVDGISRDNQSAMDESTDEFLLSSDIFENEAEEYDGSPSGESSSDSDENFEETSSSDTTSDDSDSQENDISPQTPPKGRGSFKCRKCSKVYAYKHNLKRHVKEMHSLRGNHGNKGGKNDVSSTMNSDPVFKCKECSMSYNMKCHLVKHMKYKHKHLLEHQHETCDGREKLQELAETSSSAIHQCRKCLRVFSRSCALVSHEREMHKGSDRNRELGNKAYELRSPSEDLLIRFGACPKRFSSKSLLNQHVCEILEDHNLNSIGDSLGESDLPSTSIDSLFKCHICPKGFFRKRDLTVHMNRGIHQEGITPGRDEPQSPVGESAYYCHICARSFSTESALAEHMLSEDHQDSEDSTSEIVEDELTVPSVKSRYKCKICTKVCFRQCDLTRHMNAKHTWQIDGTDESGQHELPGTSVGHVHRCKVCSHGFSRKRGLVKHLKSKHRVQGDTEESGQRFKCNICSKEFLKKAIRDMHETECNQDRDQENIGVTTEDSPATEPEVYQCNRCSRSYSRQSDLTKHMKRGKHTTRKRKRDVVTIANVPTAEYDQNDCIEGGRPKRSYVTQGNLPSSPANPLFQCKKCPESFPEECSLIEHIQSKHPEQVRNNSTDDNDNSYDVPSTSKNYLFQCGKCSESFPENCSLIEHIRSKHPEQEIDVTERNANLESHNDALPTTVCCRFCPITWLELVHKHEVVCQKPHS